MLSRLFKPLASGLQFSKTTFAPVYKFSEVRTVKGHKPPQLEDNPHGRYAGVLFSIASEHEALHIVLEDINKLKDLMSQSDAFRFFVANTALKRNEQSQVMSDVYGRIDITETSRKFLDTLIENKRLDLLPKIIERYQSYYKVLTKEEAITIISAEELSSSQADRVKEALTKAYPSVNFSLKF